ncbi:MAG: hypothetical protein IPJ32_02080 [Sphingobacteriaceae bacterium]|nr:hypothetical protein [Sphingobacteriaceae bacterium]
MGYLGFLSKNEAPPDTLHDVNYMSLMDYENYLNLKLFMDGFNSQKKSEEVEKLKRVFDEANELVFNKFQIRPFYYGLIKHFVDVYNYKEFFDIVFSKSKVKFIFIQDYHIHLQIAMCISAKKHNIRVIEIQHGILDSKYYPFINGKEDYALLPDYLWCWSIKDRDIIRKANYELNSLKPFVGGNMWLKKFLNDEVSKMDRDHELFFVKNDYERVVLITLQPVYLLSELMIEVISKSPANWLYLVRFHPLNTTEAEKQQIINELSRFTNVEIDIASKANLYQLYKKSDFQITHSSASAIEALVFNLPTIVCSDIGYDLYQSQIKDGVVFYYDKSDDIISAINAKAEPNQVNLNSYLLQSNEEEARKAIREIINSESTQ